MHLLSFTLILASVRSTGSLLVVGMSNKLRRTYQAPLLNASTIGTSHLSPKCETVIHRAQRVVASALDLPYAAPPINAGRFPMYLYLTWLAVQRLWYLRELNTDPHSTQEKDVDLLLIDTGDLHDGTGLSDGFPAGQVDGHETNNFIMDLPYDLLAIGKCVSYSRSSKAPC